MEYHNDILCITGSELLTVVSQPMYDALKRRNQIKVLRRACYGKPALIEFDSLPSKYKALFSNPQEQAIAIPFKEKVVADPKAVEFYSHYKLADGRNLEAKHQKQYCIDASVLNALQDTYNAMRNARQALGGTTKNFWSNAIKTLEAIRMDLGHNLPGSELKLKAKYKEYTEKGYESLISKKFCNENSRKVNVMIEKLLLSLYTMPNKPFGIDVLTQYMSFVTGTVQICDQKTGEIFKPEDFIKNGKPLEISKSTVWNVINNPENRSTVDSRRSGQFQFNSMHRPHHNRKAPVFSFSKVSMDDRDLPRLLTGGGRVKAYYAYDVASGCIVGKGYSRHKDEALFIDCMQDMFRLIERENLGMPLEIEVENHLVNKFFDDLHQMFSFVRICNPGNSQEKHAEHFNKAKKYGAEKKLQTGIGRWWAKSEAYRVDAPKINDQFVETNFSYERLVADDEEAIKLYNNQLHPKQKKYPGQTRWQVLINNINPNTSKPYKPTVYRGIGDHTQTSIVRNQYVTVQYEKYQLSNPQILQRLAPNNYTVDAYYLPNSEGIIEEVFLYQNGVYLCSAGKITEYSTAKAEWTEQDQAAYTEQAKFVSQFDKRKKEQRQQLITPVILNPTIENAVMQQEVVVVPEPTKRVVNEYEELLNNYNPDEYAARGITNL